MSALFVGGEAFESLGDLVVDVPDGLQHTFAAVAPAAIPKFNGFVRAGRGARGHHRLADGSVVEDDGDLRRWGCHGSRGLLVPGSSR